MNTSDTEDFKAFYRSLSATDKRRFAQEAGTTTDYIETHLVYARKVPRKQSMDRLFDACKNHGAKFDKAGLIAFFYGSPEEPHPSPRSRPPAQRGGEGATADGETAGAIA
ncbi:hypothetical protein OYT13_16825 [Pandoraea sp. XJJ-1]|uniref:hypothetical protein n=1 Tax=Pandoraea sp. XJJ-1 TaxID=3002643 RepID=UPI00228068B1|nr:hypothetical protein [Pandoraea sp. XJJ-1]WAL81503.1 hypothetical protein OYT13_16825 [Pandoraea sp. XJJ-1]